MIPTYDNSIDSYITRIKRLGQRRKFDIIHFISGSKKKTFSRWISFSPNSDGNGRSQEYYSLAPGESFGFAPLLGSLIAAMGVLRVPPLATMSYKRYGECPSWFSIGRSCSIEMQAFKFNSVSHLPPQVLDLVRRMGCEDFLKSELHYFRREGNAAATTIRGNNVYHNFREKPDAFDQFKPWYASLFQRKFGWLRK